MEKSQRILITGGAGFIGSNLAHRLINQGHEVIIFDNLSRSGCKTNLDWLTNEFGPDAFKLIKADLNDFNSLLQAAEGVNRILSPGRAGGSNHFCNQPS